MDPSIIPFQLIDNDNGTYYVKFKVNEPCVVNIDIRFKNEKEELKPIRGNPFTCGFVADKEAN